MTADDYRQELAKYIRYLSSDTEDHVARIHHECALSRYLEARAGGAAPDLSGMLRQISKAARHRSREEYAVVSGLLTQHAAAAETLAEAPRILVQRFAVNRGNRIHQL